MKKLVLGLCLLLFVFSSCAEPAVSGEKCDSLFRVGMTREEVCALDADCFACFGYLFCKSEGGKGVLCRMNAADRVAEVTEFSPAGPQKEAFSEIRPGMTMPDVVTKIGFPIRSATFGLATLDFRSSDGSEYRIQWDENRDGANWTVVEISEISQRFSPACIFPKGAAAWQIRSLILIPRSPAGAAGA